MNDILKFNQQDSLSIDDLRANLTKKGISFDDQELSELFDNLTFQANVSNSASNLEIYANAHLFRLDKTLRSPLLTKIQSACGIQEDDMILFETFSDRVDQIGELACNTDCKLYIDAE